MEEINNTRPKKINKRDLLRQQWLRIEKGLEKDDYQNPFLSHFGFYDNGKPWKTHNS
jgi:hypothetical protein